MTTFGNTNIETGGTGFYSGGSRLAKFFTPASSGEVDKITMYVDGLGAGSGATHVKALVYFHNTGTGHPTTLLDTSAEVTIADGQSAGWVDFTISGGTTLSASTAYWLGWISDNARARFWRTTSGGLEEHNNATPYVTGPLATWTQGGTEASSTLLLSIYASFGGANTSTLFPTQGQSVSLGHAVTKAVPAITETTAAAIVASRSGSGTFTASSATAASFIRQTGAVRSTSSATSPAVVKSRVALFLTSNAETVTIVTSKGRAFLLNAYAHAGSGGAPNPTTLSASSATAATLLRSYQQNKTLTPTPIVTVPTVVKGKVVTLLTGSSLALPPIFQSVTQEPLLKSQRVPTLNAVVVTVPSMGTQTGGHILLATVNEIASLTTQKVQNLKTLSATQGQSAVLKSQWNPVLLAASSPLAVRNTLIAFKRAATQGQTATVLAGHQKLFVLFATVLEDAEIDAAMIVGPGPLLIIPETPPGTILLLPDSVLSHFSLQPSIPSKR